MLNARQIILTCTVLACCWYGIGMPAHAFTANSLDITIDRNGDAVATFRFTLEGILENSIPQSVLEQELKKGLTMSDEPPELISMDRESAVLLLKKFAITSDVPTGTAYLTSTMDFKKAEIALQNSAIGSAVTADFSPATIVLTFPDNYQREFADIEVLPAVSHTVEDPAKVAALRAGATPGTGNTAPAPAAATGSMNVSSTPAGVKVSVDGSYAGEAPSLFPDLAAGTHRVDFARDGYEPVSRNVTIIAGRTTNVLVVLQYNETAAPVAAPGPDFTLPVVVILVILIAAGCGAYVRYRQQKRDAMITGEDEQGKGPAAQGPEKPGNGR